MPNEIITGRKALVRYSGVVEGDFEVTVQVCMTVGAYRIVHALISTRGSWKSTYYSLVGDNKERLSSAQWDVIEAIVAGFVGETPLACGPIPPPGLCWNLTRGQLNMDDEIDAEFQIFAVKLYGISLGGGTLNHFRVSKVWRDDPTSVDWSFRIEDTSAVVLYESFTEAPVGLTFFNVGSVRVRDNHDFRVRLNFSCDI